MFTISHTVTSDTINDIIHSAWSRPTIPITLACARSRGAIRLEAEKGLIAYSKIDTFTSHNLFLLICFCSIGNHYHLSAAFERKTKDAHDSEPSCRSDRIDDSLVDL